MDPIPSTADQVDSESSQEELEWPRFPRGADIRGFAAYKPLLPARETATPATCPPLLLLDNADTLVFIDTPPQPSSASILPTSTESIPHRIHSEKLLEAGSPFFKRLFNLRTQSRVIKRRALADRMIDGIKYAIELTPPTEGEEAVLTVTELSCPLGIRTWARAQSRWGLPLSCVGGADEYERSGTAATNGKALPQEQNVSPSVSSEKSSFNGLAAPKGSEIPVDYSPLRHRAGIEQILQALEGFLPDIDTPCKLWTFFGLARLYGIATVPRICHLILSWFYQSTNARLLEVQPELSYRIACGVQCATLCRDTFAILVGEEAMLLLANSNADTPAPLRRPEKTRYGRLRESLNDTELQRIEYASKVFLEHVANKFVNLMGADMAWLNQLSEYQKVFHYQPRTLQGHICKDDLLVHLKLFVRSNLLSTLVHNHSSTWTPGPFFPAKNKGNANADDDGYPSNTFRAAYKSMFLAERIMSRTFWQNLKSESLESNWRCRRQPSIIASLARYLPQFLDREDWISSAVSPETLGNKISDFNVFYDMHLQNGGLGTTASQPRSTNPFKTGFTQYSGASAHEVWEGNMFSTSSEGFNRSVFFEQVRSYVVSYADKMTTPPHSNHIYEFTDVLTCLTDKEFKYLPLWAGGNDDGSGGVFIDENIPVMETGGFSAPGPAIHTGSTASTIDSYSNIAPSDADSTVEGVSHRATESHTTEVVSLSTESELGSSRDNEHDLTKWQTADDDGFDFSSADDDAADFDSDSDSADTIIMDSMDHSGFVSDFEDLHLSDRASSLSH
ncbi:uncharacterized protein ACLA_084950 [Aspergillus clavatus NRRL 1]|uniref:Uncharacterized protein n=1 Tax=Aspergillus clavatus (strain ATCC 1007 / CBS 513.65 / DSM 816 / NCTC 3887 / NRRL 1 / QM 1276 / 107) TaxID=344612 RepID=A1CU13_ASPCL|nr:uncharacterized protein ACLA_084950 [Aspergillus clavatus NRRL 1]EAW06800.1 conserved hypothetical protein [Aspergillus clavatus NRRL 1]